MYEVHITIDPIPGEMVRASVEAIARECGFKLANLLMLKEGKLQKSTLDSFMTMHNEVYHLAERDMLRCIHLLHGQGLIVRRYKIECIILDSKYQDDPFGLVF